MTEPQFTCAPWKVIPADGFNSRIAISAKGAEKYSSRGPIALVGKRHKNAMANAYLIAAAPEMYEALEEILSDLDTFPQVAPGVDHPEVFDLKLKLRKLLRKARGESEVEK